MPTWTGRSAGWSASAPAPWPASCGCAGCWQVSTCTGLAWPTLAAELGWYDQAHLIRDFKRHTGVTPSEYVSAQRATYEPDVAASSAGFVPEKR